MERSKAEAVIEAILFTMGDSVEISRLAEVIEEDVKTTKSILKDMAARYEEENRGIGLTQFDDSVQLCTKADMYEYLIKIAKTPRKMTLTDTVLETLSIIAYKQPVTRLEIERVRGVSCDHAINKLLEYDLITELGRLDAPGRPLLFGTTEQFLRCWLSFTGSDFLLCMTYRRQLLPFIKVNIVDSFESVNGFFTFPSNNLLYSDV